MARPKSLASLSIEALLKLRDDIGTALAKRAGDMKQQLARLSGGTDVGDGRRGRRKSGPLKGRKIAPKYRGPRGETWAGGGARPRWLVEAVKGGKKLEDFLIAKKARAAKRKAKR